MFERFGPDARQAILLGAEEASVRRRDPRIGTEHLLIGAVAVGSPVAEAHGVDERSLRDTLDRLDRRALVAVGVETEVPAPGQRAPTVHRPWFGLRPRGHLPFTSAAKQALERSLRICLDHRQRRITSEHLLAALVAGPAHDPAVRMLSAAGVDPVALGADARRALAGFP